MPVDIHCDCCHCIPDNSNPTVESSDEVISLSNESDNLKLYFQIRSTIPQCDCCYCITSNTSPTKRTISSEDLIEFGRRIHMMSVEIRNLKIKLNQDYTENIKRKFNCKDCNDGFGWFLPVISLFMPFFLVNIIFATDILDIINKTKGR